MIFAPSVRLPAPSVTNKSASTFLASAVISKISDHRVCGFIPFRTPVTLPSNAACSCRTYTVSLDSVPEAIIYTRLALKVFSTCLAQACGNGKPYEICGYPLGKAGR